ncbi:hypothetical protein CWN17_12665, partial [Klebsiella pneumoniae]
DVSWARSVYKRQNQSSEQPREAMKYGVSVTDACISWETTEALLRELDKDLRGHLAARLV